MAVLTREQRNQCFDCIKSKVLQIDVNDSSHELLMKLTQNAKRILATLLNMNRSGLKDLKSTDSEGNTLSFDDWEVREIINISRFDTY